MKANGTISEGDYTQMVDEFYGYLDKEFDLDFWIDKALEFNKLLSNT